MAKRRKGKVEQSRARHGKARAKQGITSQRHSLAKQSKATAEDSAARAAMANVCWRKERFTMKQTEPRRRYFGRLIAASEGGKDRTKSKKRKKAKK